MKNLRIILVLAAVSIATFGFIRIKKNPAEIGLNIGNKAPELVFKSPEGKEIALSKINKDKYVLIDFWASWCGPCRMENPTVVKAYKKYKDKKFKGAKGGFTIYSVSLDRAMEPWKMAIAKDSLMWEGHVSDLGFWQSEAAKIYGVQSIPTNFLIDAEGIIVGKGLRGMALENELNKFLE